MRPTSIRLDDVDVQHILQREFDFGLVKLILTKSLLEAITELLRIS
jgi:hypothetical protein